MRAPDLLVGALEIALNRYLRLEPAVLAECGRLSGRCIALSFDGPGWTFFIEPDAQGVRVAAQRAAEADVTVRGPLTLLLRLAWRTAQGAGGVPQGLQVAGDTELLARFNRLLAQVGFDPEELLAKYLGDAAGHRVHEGLQKIFGWGRSTAQTLGLDTAEYLREETRDLARAADVADWMSGVDDLRDAVERFEARLARLEERA
jgi:ubiquinone biosynthesis accessory factor UbiJ